MQSRKRIDWQSGQILPMALVLLAAAVFIIVPGLFATQISLGVNKDAEKDLRGYYAAEAGIADAVWKYKSGNAPFISTSSPGEYYELDDNINGLKVRVTLLKYADNNNADNYYIQSSALSGTVMQSRIIATIIYSGSSVSNVFDLAVASLDGDIYMSGSAEVSSDDNSVSLGDAYANGNITAKNYGVTINGNAFATGTIGNRVAVGGTSEPGAEELTMPSVDIEAFEQKAQQGQTVSSFSKNSGTWNLGGAGNPSYITGDLELSGTATANIVGTVYVGGEITMGNSATIRGGNAIVCDGDITLRGAASGQLPEGTTPIVISINGDVTLANSAKLSAIVYAPMGEISMTGDTRLWGAAVGKSVTLKNSTQVIYQTSVREWGELYGAGGATTSLAGYDYQ